MVDKVEQVARLIRSKGVGVYFITQNPADVPEDILGQLGNRIQHALRAFTGRDRKELKQAAETYRDNPRFSTEDAIREVGVGEAVTSFLEAKGAPGVVERTLIRPPSSQLGPIDAGERKALIDASPIAGKYETLKDRDSAYEMLTKRAADAAKEAEEAERREAEAEETLTLREFNSGRRYTGNEDDKTSSRRRSRKSSDEGFSEAVLNVVVKELKGTTGKRIVRGIFGSLFKGR